MRRMELLVERARCSLDRRAADSRSAERPRSKTLFENNSRRISAGKLNANTCGDQRLATMGCPRLSVPAGALGHPALPNACSIARCASPSTAANRNTSPPPSCIWAPKCATARAATAAHSSRPPPRAPEPSNGTDTVRWPDSRAPTRNKIRSKVPIPGNIHLDRHSNWVQNSTAKPTSAQPKIFTGVVRMKLDSSRGSQRPSERNGATACRTNL